MWAWILALFVLIVYPYPSHLQKYQSDYSQKLERRLKTNDQIIVELKTVGHQIHLDLIVDTTRIPFHLKIDVPSLLFNSKIDDDWLDEIKLGNATWLPSTNHLIIITILPNEDLKVELDTNPAHQVQKRDSLNDVKTVRVYGSFTLTTLKILHGEDEALEVEEKSNLKLIIGIVVAVVLFFIFLIGVFCFLTCACCVQQPTTDTGSNRSDLSTETS